MNLKSLWKLGRHSIVLGDTETPLGRHRSQLMPAFAVSVEKAISPRPGEATVAPEIPHEDFLAGVMGPVETELTATGDRRGLETVEVVRNDLCETDLEVVVASRTKEMPWWSMWSTRVSGKKE